MQCTGLLTVIVLTKDEERNLPDLLDSIMPLQAIVWVIDSGSTDGTVAIAKAAGCEVAEHPFENYAAQRNWAFEHLPITTPWTLCLDADERLTLALVQELRSILSRPDDIPYDGFMLRKRTIFMGRWLKHGGQYPSWHLRLFRTGKGRCEDRLYDQHFLVDGAIGRLNSDYIDVLTDSLTKWVDRHNHWATLESLEMEDINSDRQQVIPRLGGSPIELKRFLRYRMYHRAPKFARAFLLFLFDYFLRLGFLDGRPGLVFHVLQRFWFRFLVDAKLYERSISGSAGTRGKRPGTQVSAERSLTSSGRSGLSAPGTRRRWPR